MCGMVHLDTDMEGGHDIDIPWEIWGKDNPLPLTEMQNFTKNTTLGLFQKFPERDFLFLGFVGPPMVSANVWATV